MTLKSITSRSNPLFKSLKRLAESSRERRETGRTLLDGIHLIEAYQAAWGHPELLVVTDEASRQREVQALLDRGVASQAIELPMAMFRELAPVRTPTGVMAVIDYARQGRPAAREFCVLIEDVQDPGNLGAILRSAAAAGADCAWLSHQCADVWSPKVLRAGMGAHFCLEVEESVDLVARARHFGGQVLAASLAAETSVFDVDMTGPVAFIIGNEGAGLSPALEASATRRVRIPMPGRIESLNAAAAAAILFFERVRQVGQGNGP
ncbi:MAG: RNA methyltransferase [Betaproteobacteria bacterium]|nr:RNA methyltransferase [Betaproteobacteria bacterium]